MPNKKIPAWKPKTCLKNQPWEHSDFVRNDLGTNTTGAPTELKAFPKQLRHKAPSNRNGGEF